MPVYSLLPGVERNGVYLGQETHGLERSESEEKSLQGRRTEVNGYILQPMINLTFASVEGGVPFKAALIHDELAPQNQKNS